jgi:hypothetical protein
MCRTYGALGYHALGTQPASDRRAGLNCDAPTALAGGARGLDVNRAISDLKGKAGHGPPSIWWASLPCLNSGEARSTRRREQGKEPARRPHYQERPDRRCIHGLRICVDEGAILGQEGNRVTRGRRRVDKYFRLDPVKIKLAQKVLRTGTETEAIERALDFVISEHERNRLDVEELVKIPTGRVRGNKAVQAVLANREEER